MKNIEKWYVRLIEMESNKASIAVVDNKPVPCRYTDCQKCQLHKNSGYCGAELVKWLNAEYEEPKTDWTKVEKRTRVLVSNDMREWYRGYFSYYYDGAPYPFYVLSHPKPDEWSDVHEESAPYAYCILAEDEDE